MLLGSLTFWGLQKGPLLTTLSRPLRLTPPRMLSKLRFSSRIHTTFSILSFKLAMDSLEPEAYPKGVLLDAATAAAAALLERPSKGTKVLAFMMMDVALTHSHLLSSLDIFYTNAGSLVTPLIPQRPAINMICWMNK